jgi:hypothetical protein
VRWGGVLCRPCRAASRIQRQEPRRERPRLAHSFASPRPSGVAHALVPGVSVVRPRGRCLSRKTQRVSAARDRAHVHLSHTLRMLGSWVLVHRPQEHCDREVLDVVVHTGIVHGCRLGTVVTTRPSRGRVSAVLGAVNASALCADRYAASGIDGASAQLTTRHLRDGRGGDCLVRPDA